MTPTPTVTPTSAPDLSRLSWNRSQLSVSITGYRVTYDDNGVDEQSFYPFGTNLEQSVDHTGSWHSVNYSNNKQLWVRDVDKDTFNGSDHVTGIYSMEAIDVSGQDVMVLRGSGKGETLAVAMINNDLAYGYTDPTKFGVAAGTQRTIGGDIAVWRGIQSGAYVTAYNMNSPLGYRSGTVDFVKGDESITNRYGYGARIGDHTPFAGE